MKQDIPFCYLKGEEPRNICAVCNETEIKPGTKDHIVPEWLVKNMQHFGFLIEISNNIQMICTKCNTKKGGNINYSDERVRSFMRLFANTILRKVDEHERN